MEDRRAEEKPAGVSDAKAPTKQAGEARTADWGWVERSAWTKRMLDALDKGVKGGVWFSLIDKVYAKRNLRRAFEKVRANKGAAGVDRISVDHFAKNLPREIEKLHAALKEGCYEPQAVRRKLIEKPGSKQKRPLGIPTVRDRVVQTALRNVIEPIFEKQFAEHSYGFRPGRGCKDALRRVWKRLEGGARWVVDADIRSYFDNIPHDQLMAEVSKRVQDSRTLALIEKFLTQKVMDSMSSWTPEKGSPQGAVISPLLANIYLNPLDHKMAKERVEMVRYADDLLILAETRQAAEKALAEVEAWMKAHGLRLHPEKTRIVNMNQAGEGFDFLGYRFEVSKKKAAKINRWPSRKSAKKLRGAVKILTKRNSGESLEAIIGKINQILRGWFEYFKNSKPTTFPGLDGWVRMRLRSILRKRRGLKGKGRGNDHLRWPNRYFSSQGLFSMVTTQRELVQSSRR